jgi:hypothetical protein
MCYLVLTDTHANIDALQAVEAQFDNLRVLVN